MPSVFESEHRFGVTFFNVGIHIGKFNMKIWFSNWRSEGHKWMAQLVERQHVELQTQVRIFSL